MLKFTKIVKLTVSVVNSGSSCVSVMRFSTKVKPHESVTDFSIKKRPTRTKKVSLQIINDGATSNTSLSARKII